MGNNHLFVLTKTLIVVLFVLLGQRSSWTQESSRSATRRSHVDSHGDPLPGGAIARLGTLRFRTRNHQSDTSVAFVPGQSLLMSAAPQGGLGIWDAETGKLQREIRLTGLDVKSFDSSSDGAYIAALGQRLRRETREWNNRLQVFRVNGEAVFDVGWTEPIQEQARRLAFTPDGKRIATGGRRGQVRVWDLSSGEMLQEHRATEGELEALDFSPDGQWLAVASRHEVVIWKWLEGGESVALLRRGNRHRGAMSLAFSPDGKWMATGSDEHRGIRVWDFATRRLQWRIDGSKGGSYYPERIEFTADSKMLVVPVGQQGQRIEIRDATTGELVRSYDASGVDMRHAAVSSDQEWIAGFGYRHAIHVWRRVDGEARHEKYPGHYHEVYLLEFTPDGQQIVTADFRFGVRVWDAQNGQPLQAIKRATRSLASMSVSPDGKYIGTTAFDDTSRVWDLKTGLPVYRFLGHARLGAFRANTVAFSADATRFLSFGDDMFLRVWELRNGTAVTEHNTRRGGFDVARFTPDRRHLLLMYDDCLDLIETDSGKIVGRRLNAKFGRWCGFDVSPDGKRLATVEMADTETENQPDHVIRIRDLMSHERLRDVKIPRLRRGGELKFGPFGKRVAL